MKQIYFVIKSFILLLFFTPLILTAATTSLTNSTSNTISDNSCFDRTFNVSLSPSSINNVTISVDVIHTYRGDLELYLTSPSATTVQLTVKDGNNGADNLHVLLSDTASTSITSDTSSHTSLVNRKPANPLNLFNGESPQGIWTLQVCDRYNGDNGTFNTSTLTIDYTLPNTPPTANAGADQTSSFGTALTLNGSGTDSDGSISSYLWQEGATTLSTSASFTKSDFTLGTHTLTLTVTDNNGATATDTVVITIVGNLPPVANAGADQLINLGDNTSLDASGSSDSDGSIVSYLWQEGATTLSTNINFTLPPLSAGIHTITLTVTDDQGEIDTDTVVITVNTPPIANAGADQNVTLGTAVTFNGSASSDDFNNISSYVWTQGGSTIATGVSPSFTFSTAGIYTVTLTVTDNNGLTDSDDVIIHVNTAPVVEDMNFTILKDTSVSFALTAADDDGDTIVSFPIFTSPTHGSLSGTESNLTYTPDTNYTGTDTFTYKAFDGIDNSNEGTVTITVVPPATAVHDDFNTTYNTLLNGNVLNNDLGLNIKIIDFNTTANGLLNVSDDGSFTYLPDTLFDGNDTFSYTIKDDFNITSTTTVTIVIYPPRADLSISKTAPAQSDVGLAIDYTLTIQSNAGTQYITAENARVIDDLPSGVQYSGVTAPSGWTCGQVGGTVTCDASAIPPGYSGNIIIHAYAPHILGNSVNTATVASDTIDPDLSNNTSSATTNVIGLDVDLGITKTVSSPTVNTTASFSYTLSVQNSGSADTTGVVVKDTLNPSLGFISINSGADWSCSQGSNIICTYIANGGVFVAGGSSNNIIINVRAPATDGNITNNASVDSDTLEVNTANNSDSVDVNITTGSNQTSGVPLSKYLQYNFYGDMKLIGNANINKLPGDSDENYNDSIDMHYVDTDGDDDTYNSSSSILDINSTYKIIWAGLYWEGHICSDQSDGTGDGSGTGCNWENSPFSNFNNATSSIGSIKFKTPHRTAYMDLSAHTLHTSKDNKDWTYSAFRDITDLLDSNETGTYTAANIVLTEGKKGGGGNYGGWAMLVIYEDDNQTLHYKNISVFNGFEVVNDVDNPSQVDISGFLTPQSGTVNGSVALFAADGDPAVGGYMQMRNGTNTTYGTVSNTANPSNNVLNSTITEFGIPINSGITKTYGVDADRIDISSFLVNNQTNTSFRFGAGTSTQRDYYTISLFAFATDLTTPLIDNFSKSAVIIDRDGTRRVAGPNEPIYPGSSLEYTITFTNTGDEVAEAVEIFDDFDFDGLSQALDTDHFDTTKLKLFNGTTTTSEVTNADCSYDISDHRVICKLPTVAIDQTFTMQFVVNVKNVLDASIFDQNASNTAYSKYKNPNGNTYVEFYTTPITNESVGGKSNALNSGIFSSINRGGEKYISIDAINENYSYDGPTRDRNITTKIVNRPFNIKLVHRDINLSNTPYQAWQGNKPMAVLVTLENGGKVTHPLNNPAEVSFNQGQLDITMHGLELKKAHRNERLRLAYLDWNKILSWAPSTSACVVNSDQSTNLSGMPACFNSYQYVEDMFPRDSFPQVAICYGIGIPAGSDYACNPLAYNTGGTQANGNIFPTVYNHPFGCYQCITQGFANFKHDSTDDFAARPDHFELDSQHAHFPDLLRSGHDYNLSIIAKDGDDNNTLDYNTTSNTLRMEDPKLDPAGNINSTITLEGNGTIKPIDTNITNGVSVDADGNPADVLGFTFNNVGDVGITIYDPAWANVDADDTPIECNATAQSIHNIPIEAVRSVCGSITTRFIPHHFELTASLYNHDRDGEFTYIYSPDDIHDLKNMSAHVEVKIDAVNEQNNTTTNFKKDAYENDLSVQLNVTDWNTTLVGLKPTPRLDTNITIKDIPNPIPLGFGTNNNPAGTYTIDANDSTPFAQRILFNYKREINKPKDPFSINGREANLTVTSIYTTSMHAPEGSADINGTSLADQNATFYYGSILPQSPHYQTDDDYQITPIYIAVYCNASIDYDFQKCRNLGIDTTYELIIDSEDNNKWWPATRHSIPKDGNVSLISDTYGDITPPAFSTYTNDANVTLAQATSRPAKVTIRLDKDKTAAWLLYDKTTAYPNSYFIEDVTFDQNSTPPPPPPGAGAAPTSYWTGLGKAGHVVDGNASRKINNRRLGW